MELGAIRPVLSRFSLAVFFFAALSVGAYICTRYLNSSNDLITGNPPQDPILATQNVHKIIDIPLNCSLDNSLGTCPTTYYPSNFSIENKNFSPNSPPFCPDYFRWIHDDLWPWRETGITREMVESANGTANFRLVILNGKAYVKTYSKAFQSRDTFTLWGILQLLRKYPGKVPDLDLMFDCNDYPAIGKDKYKVEKYSAPPTLFKYCGNENSYDIVFPDWSFWGWPEINIKPWEELLKEIKEENKKTPWVDREPYAYWKGNPDVGGSRRDLLKCNVSDQQEWNARIYAQDWRREQEQGYKESNLANQCIHKYKIYIEGNAWSVSEKYILACDSLTLLIEPLYHAFFSRGLMPLQHYWPIKTNDKCRSIKYAVERGNKHEKEAQSIIKAASKFISEEIKMDYIYDYMFHLLNEYAKLLTYKPIVPEGAVELCSESMFCERQGLEKKFMTDTLVNGPSYSDLCTMPPPYDPASLHSFLETKRKSIDQVQTWEKQYYESQDKHV